MRLFFYNNQRISLFVIWLALFIFYITLLMWQQPHLPEKVAVRFDLSDNPIGWMPKATFIKFKIIFASCLNAIFFIFSVILMKFVPPKLCNLPYKHYWFATPERAVVGKKLACNVMIWSGIFMNAIFLFLTHLVGSQPMCRKKYCLFTRLHWHLHSSCSCSASYYLAL